MRNRIKEIRESKGITQEKLGERIGASQSKVNHMEKGNRRIKIDEMEKIAVALESTVEEVFFGESPSNILPFPQKQKEKYLKIIELVERFLKNKGVDLPPEKKAKLIVALIDKASKEDLEEAEIIQFADNYAAVEAI